MTFFDLLFDNQRKFHHSCFPFLLIRSWARMFLMGLDLVVRRREVLGLALGGVVFDEKGSLC